VALLQESFPGSGCLRIKALSLTHLQHPKWHPQRIQQFLKKFGSPTHACSESSAGLTLPLIPCSLSSQHALSPSCQDSDSSWDRLKKAVGYSLLARSTVKCSSLVPLSAFYIGAHTHTHIYNFFFLFRDALVAYVSFQARSHVGAAPVSLHHSHSNTGSELHLQPTP